MQDTGVICPSCGVNVGRANPSYCPSCRTPLVGQRPSEADRTDRSLADPFGDWPEVGEQAFANGLPQPEEPPATVPSEVQTRTRGSRKIVTVLVVIAVIGLIRLVPIVIDAVSGAERDSEGAVVEGGTASVFDIRVGDCFNLSDDAVTSVQQADLVPCTDPHMYEAYAQYVYPDTSEADYPGEVAIFDFSDEYCLQEFESFVGHRWETSVLDFAYLYPEEDGWQIEEDRTVLCLIQPIDENPLVGSMRQAGI